MNVELSTALPIGRIETKGYRNAASIMEELKEKPLPHKLDIIHQLIAPYIEKTGITEHMRGKKGVLHPEVEEKLRKSLRRNEMLKNAISSPTAKENLEAVKSRLESADLKSQGDSLINVTRKRLSEFKKKAHVISDLDNSITDHSKMESMKCIHPLLLGSEILDPMIGEDREHFLAVHAAMWGYLVEHFPEVFREGGKNTPIREGMKDLFHYLAQKDVRASILSTNFVPFVEGAVSNLPYPHRIDIMAIDGKNTMATLKGEVVNYFIAKDPETPIIVIGDGKSDESLMPAVNNTAAIFALDGAGFQKKLAEYSIPHFAFGTGFDIQSVLTAVI